MEAGRRWREGGGGGLDVNCVRLCQAHDCKARKASPVSICIRQLAMLQVWLDLKRLHSMQASKHIARKVGSFTTEVLQKMQRPQQQDALVSGMCTLLQFMHLQ